MPVKPEDRPIEALRQEVIDQLIMNYSHAELSLEAFERRLDQAMETSDHRVLTELTTDLELTTDQQFVDNKKAQMSGNYIEGETVDVEYIFQVFSGSDRTGEWKLPKEIRIMSIFSGSNIDLTDAVFTHPVVKIRLLNIFSGDNIYVPENANVTTNIFCIFGGVDNSVSTNALPNSPTIIIEGFAIFSGLDIKIKRSLKERFVIFADKLKSFLS